MLRSLTTHSRMFMARIFVFGTFVGIGIASSAVAQEKITFDDHVQAIFRQHCSTCHNADRLEGDLDLTNYTSMIQGGGSGEAIQPGSSGDSYLFNLVTHDDEPSMPPDSDPIPEGEIEILKKWIDGGALENKGSKAIIIDKPKVELALSGPVNERPAVLPMPAHLVKQPVNRTSLNMSVTSLATSPWSPLVAVAGQRQVLLYHTETLELLGVLPFPEGQPNVLKFSRNGQLLLAGGGRHGASGKVVVWNIRDGQRVIEVGDELDTVLAADISSDQTMIALGGPQRLVRVYATSNGELLYEIKKHTDWVFTLEFSPDGVLLATGDRSGGLLVWEAMTGREYLDLRGHKGGINAVSWREDSNVLASASEDQTAKTWELNEGKPIKSWTAHRSGVAAIEFARDGRLVTCGRDKTSKIWGQDGKQIRALEAFGDLATAASICDETDRVIAGDWIGDVRVWNAKDGKRLGELSGNPMTIEERIAAAKADLGKVNQGYETLESQAIATGDKLAKLTKKIAELKQAQQTSAKDAESAVKRITDGERKLAEFETKSKTATARVQQLQTAIPTLLTAESHLSQAEKALGKDARLAELTNSARVVGKQIEQELEKLKLVASEVTAQVAAQKKQIAAARTLVANSKKTKSEVEAELAKLEPQIEPSTKAAQAAKTTFAERKSQVTRLTEQLAHWNGELAFAKTMNGLQTQVADARELLRKRLEDEASAKQQLDEQSQRKVDAQQDLAAIDKEMAAAVAEIDKVEEAMATTSEEIEGTGADVVTLVAKRKTLNVVLESLQEANESVQRAAEQVNDDKQLADATERMLALVDSKQKALDQNATITLQKREFIKEREMMMDDLIASRDKMVKQSAEIERRRRDAVAKVEQIEKDLESVTGEHRDVTQAVEKTREKLDQLASKIAQAQGINSTP